MKIRALDTFMDGNIFAQQVEAGQVVEVNQREYELIISSGGRFEVVPDGTPVTPVPVPALELPADEKQLAARQLKEKQELEARHLRERQALDAEKEARKDAKFIFNVTNPEGEAQATKVAEEATAEKEQKAEAEPLRERKSESRKK